MQRTHYELPVDVKWQKPKKTRRAAYFRVSSKSLIQEESFIFQKREWEEKLGMMPNTEVVGFYSDTISGYHDTKRDGFQRLIRDAMNGKIDVIHCKAISRFCRAVPLLIQTLRKLADRGVAVILDQENINSLDAKQNLLLQLQGIIAENDVKNNKFLVEQSRRRGYEKGKPYITIMPYGFFQECRPEFVLNEKEAVYVRKVFEMYLQGSGYHIIANHLNSRGARTRSGWTWQTSTVKKILTNEKYVGDFHCQKRYTDENHVNRENRGEVKSWYIENNHKGIIDRDTWERTHAKLESEKRKVVRKKPFNETSKKGLVGKITCSECERNIVRKRDFTGNGQRRYWVCQYHGCRGNRISESTMNDLAFSAYREYAKQDHIQKGKLEIRLQEILKDQSNLTALKDGRYINQESYAKELERITTEFRRVDDAMRKSHDKTTQEFTEYCDELCEHIDRVFVHGNEVTFQFINGQEIKLEVKNA